MYLPLLLAAASSLLVFLVAFFWAIEKKNNNSVDIAWAISFIATTSAGLLANHTYHPRQTLVALLIALWGIRLAIHIYSRNKGKPEDFRYQKFRNNWGGNFALKAFFKIYLLQWLLQLVIALPALLIVTSTNTPLNTLDLLGLSIWLTGFYFEAVGDWQLTKFKKDPRNKGKIMTKGLWRYSRHPNYFGEATLWWGIWLMALNIPLGFLTIVSPITIDYMLLKVSGIPMLEAKYKGNKKFQEYKKRTSAFFPLPPKDISSSKAQD